MLAWVYFGHLTFTTHKAKVLKLKDRTNMQKIMERTEDLKESIEFDMIRGVVWYSNATGNCEKLTKEALGLQTEVRELKAKIYGVNGQSKKVEEAISSLHLQQVKMFEEISFLTKKHHDYFASNVQLQKRVALLNQSKNDHQSSIAHASHNPRRNKHLQPTT